MTEASREYVMELLATMVVADKSLKENKNPEDVLRDFRKSKTYAMLFDAETGLWMNGPDYISDEYNFELYGKYT